MKRQEATACREIGECGAKNLELFKELVKCAEAMTAQQGNFDALLTGIGQATGAMARVATQTAAQ